VDFTLPSIFTPMPTLWPPESLDQRIGTGLTWPLKRLGGLATPFHAAAALAVGATATLVFVAIPPREAASTCW
jgi:hypothetical protein